MAVEFISLDGVIQAPGGSKEDTQEGFEHGGWVGPYFDKDPMLDEEMNKQMEGEYDLLLGRKTYDIFSGYWPNHPEGWPQVNKITKYVLSKTLANPVWEHTVVLKDIDELRKLKDANGPLLQIYGSSNLIQTLMKQDLVDEYWLKIFPVTLGTGKRLWGEGTQPATFSLIDSKISKSGVIVATYKRIGKLETKDVG